MSRNEITYFEPGFDLFDPFFSDDFFRREAKGERNLLKTDIVENENDYELIMDVPGTKKENINIEVDNGYLTISVKKNTKEEDSKKNFIRKERHYFEASRSFYVGEVDEAQVNAKLENGELHITVPKEQKQPKIKKQISIQ